MLWGCPQDRQGLAAFRSIFLVVARVIFLKQKCHQISPLIKFSHCPPTASKSITALPDSEGPLWAWFCFLLLLHLLQPPISSFSLQQSQGVYNYSLPSLSTHTYTIQFQVSLFSLYPLHCFLCSCHSQHLLLSYPVSLLYNYFLYSDHNILNDFISYQLLLIDVGEAVVCDFQDLALRSLEG